jgi:ElaB/YqjD/DUF883 family membrane-anchored ribosome-binding protein
MTAKDQIIEKKNQLSEKAKEIAHTAEEKATMASHSAGEGLEKVASVVRRGSTSAADRFEQVGSYLQQHDMRDMTGELTTVIRNNPIPSLIAGLAAGFLIGRVLAR